VRLGINSDNEFMLELNEKNQKIQETYLEKIKKLSNPISTKVMLGDSTVTEQTTFDPNLITNFYQNMLKNLTNWTIQEVSITNNEDVRRIFTKFEIQEGSYILSGHTSIQLHVLLYYKPDQKVLENQKELADIMDTTKNTENKLAELGDQFIITKLKEMGYSDVDHQKLFELFFENEELREKLYSQIEGSTDVDFQKLSKRKMDLFHELDNLLLETYQMAPVLIDEIRLVGGEEGCVCTFDLEFIKNKTKQGSFDLRRIPKDIQNKLKERLDQVYDGMNINA